MLHNVLHLRRKKYLNCVFLPTYYPDGVNQKMCPHGSPRGGVRLPKA
jgi:hypothetical protein